MPISWRGRGAGEAARLASSSACRRGRAGREDRAEHHRRACHSRRPEHDRPPLARARGRPRLALGDRRRSAAALGTNGRGGRRGSNAGAGGGARRRLAGRAATPPSSERRGPLEPLLPRHRLPRPAPRLRAAARRSEPIARWRGPRPHRPPRARSTGRVFSAEPRSPAAKPAPDLFLPRRRPRCAPPRGSSVCVVGSS